MKQRINIWDAIAWLALFGIVIWLIFKILRFINTPILIEYSPIFAAVYMAGWAIHKLEIVSSNVKEQKNLKEL